MIDIDALEALEKAATPGPWSYWGNGFDGYIAAGVRDAKEEERPAYKTTKVVDAYIFGGESHEGYLEEEDPNVAFTVAARNALPALLRELRAARLVVAEARVVGPDCGWNRPRLPQAIAAYDAAVKGEK